MAPRVAVIDYGIGNLRSAEKALQRVGADAWLSSDSDEILGADAVVLPGVGNFGRCIAALHDNGLAQTAIEAANSGRPFLGICVGMQMLFESSAEAPGVAGLGLLDGSVELLGEGVRRPQMQWNPITCGDSSALEDLDGEWMYFVHSYAVMHSKDALATADYGGRFVAAAGRDQIVATQFHPEKSGDAGRRFLTNFVARIGVRS